jgi:hypothetical protein
VSLISDFRSALSAATAATWSDTAKVAIGQKPIGGFESDADAAFAVKAKAVAPKLIALYDAVKLAQGGSFLGLTYIAKAKRVALDAALKALE